jgi:hypothetical protein
MLAGFELTGGRTIGLTQLASPRFEEKEALSARQYGNGELLDHPRLRGDFHPAKMADWTAMSGVSPVQRTRNVRPTKLIGAMTITSGRGTRGRVGGQRAGVAGPRGQPQEYYPKHRTSLLHRSEHTLRANKQHSLQLRKNAEFK